MTPHKISEEKLERLNDPKRELLFSKNDLKHALGNIEGSTILDYGTGTGYYLPLLSALTGPNGKVLAMDIMEAALNQAISIASSLSNVHVQQIQENNIPLPPESVNTVLTIFTAHEFHSLDKTLKEIKRILKQNGQLILIDWCPDSLLEAGPPLNHRISKQTIINASETNDIKLEKEFTPSEHVYFLRFKPVFS